VTDRPAIEIDIKVVSNMIKNKQPNQYTYGAYIIPNELTLTCKECGHKQTYVDKYSYRRAMGIGPDKTQKNKGLCGKCSRSAKRRGWTLSEEHARNRRLNAIKHQTPYDSVEEWAKADRKKRRWYEICDKMSRENLKKYQPDEYKRFMENKYDGTNYETGLTIEHIRPKSECFKTNELLECSNISNLKIVTMKENVELWEKYAENNDIKNGEPIKVIKKQTHNFW